MANGYLRLDRAEWIRVVEKLSAALQDASGGKSGGKGNLSPGPTRETAGGSVGRAGLEPATDGL